MAKTILVRPDIALGKRIVETLDSESFPVTVAMWILQKERDDDWVLLASTPLYDQLGAREAYGRLIKIISTHYPYAVSEIPIRLESNRRPFIKALRKIPGKAAPVEGMRLGLHWIGDTWVDDAYVYRIK